MDKRDFTRFESNMRFGRKSDSKTTHWNWKHNMYRTTVQTKKWNITFLYDWEELEWCFAVKHVFLPCQFVRFSRGKNCMSVSARVQFFQRKIERINNTVARHVLLISRICFLHKQKIVKMLMNNKFKAQGRNRKSYQKFALSCFSVTCFKHVGLPWPISALDRKQVRGYTCIPNIMLMNQIQWYITKYVHKQSVSQYLGWYMCWKKSVVWDIDLWIIKIGE